jgi:hypothetical protein
VSCSCVMDQKRSDRISKQRGVGFLCNGSEKIRQDQHIAWCRFLVDFRLQYKLGIGKATVSFYRRAMPQGFI